MAWGFRWREGYDVSAAKPNPFIISIKQMENT